MNPLSYDTLKSKSEMEIKISQRLGKNDSLIVREIKCSWELELKLQVELKE